MDLKIELGSLPLFADLTPDQIAWLSGHCEEVALAPGEALIEEGGKGESFYVLLDGELEVARQAAGQEIRLATLDTAGDFVGEISLLSGNAPIATVRGNRPSRLIRFTAEAFREMLGVCPPVVFQFIQATARRLKYNEGLTQQQEKLAGLGKISAGLAHDLNNPAAAALRAAKTLAETLESLKTQTVALARTPLDPGHLERLSAVIREDSGAPAASSPPPSSPDPLRESELEDEISDWLDDRDVADGWRLAPTFAQAGLSVERLEGLAEGAPREALPAAIAWLEQSLAASVLVREVEMAAGANSRARQRGQVLFLYGSGAPAGSGHTPGARGHAHHPWPQIGRREGSGRARLRSGPVADRGVRGRAQPGVDEPDRQHH